MEDELVNRSATLDASLSLESPGEAREDDLRRAQMEIAMRCSEGSAMTHCFRAEQALQRAVGN